MRLFKHKRVMGMTGLEVLAVVGIAVAVGGFLRAARNSARAAGEHRQARERALENAGSSTGNSDISAAEPRNTARAMGQATSSMGGAGVRVILAPLPGAGAGATTVTLAQGACDLANRPRPPGGPDQALNGISGGRGGSDNPGRSAGVEGAQAASQAAATQAATQAAQGASRPPVGGGGGGGPPAGGGCGGPCR